MSEEIVQFLQAVDAAHRSPALEAGEVRIMQWYGGVPKEVTEIFPQAKDTYFTLFGVEVHRKPKYAFDSRKEDA